MADILLRSPASESICKERERGRERRGRAQSVPISRRMSGVVASSAAAAGATATQAAAAAKVLIKKTGVRVES